MWGFEDKDPGKDQTGPRLAGGYVYNVDKLDSDF